MKKSKKKSENTLRQMKIKIQLYKISWMQQKHARRKFVPIQAYLKELGISQINT